MNFRLLLLTASLLTTGAFAQLDCANADGSIVYHQWGYEGGAAPAQGMKVAQQTLVYKGQEIAKSESFEGGPYHAFPVEQKEVAGTNKPIAGDSAPYETNAIYAHQVTLSRVDGAPVLPDRTDTTVTDYFLCHLVRRMLP